MQSLVVYGAGTDALRDLVMHLKALPQPAPILAIW